MRDRAGIEVRTTDEGCCVGDAHVYTWFPDAARCAAALDLRTASYSMQPVGRLTSQARHCAGSPSK